MNRVVVISVRLLVIVTFLSICIISLMMTLFLRTVSALTGEEKVAQVVMYPIQEDNNGEYIEIDYIPYANHSALYTVFNSEEENIAEIELEIGQSQRFRLYGDVIAVRGPLITLHPTLRVLGFGNVYKIALLEGEYRSSANRSGIEGSEALINGGFNDFWWNLNDVEGAFPHDLYVKRVTFSGDEEPGFYGEGVRRYDIVVTMDTITWNRVDDE